MNHVSDKTESPFSEGCKLKHSHGNIPNDRIYDENFSRQYGFWRPYVEQVIYRYLDCGDLHNDFARVECKDCNH